MQTVQNQTAVTTIEPAEPAEREWCARLMASSDPWIRLGRGLPQCRERLSDPEYVLRIARCDGVLRGFILMHPRGVAGSPYVASIAVAEEARGAGIGGLLLDWAEEHYGRRSARHMFLCVSSFNAGARRLYERRGYSLVAELTGYVIPGASELLMHKWLVSE